MKPYPEKSDRLLRTDNKKLFKYSKKGIIFYRGRLSFNLTEMIDKEDNNVIENLYLWMKI